MVHPRYRLVAPDEALPQSLTPVYPTTAGVSQGALRKLILPALAAADLGELLDARWCRRHALPDFADAVRLLHAPPPAVAEDALQGRTHPAWRRIKFDEVLAQQLSLRRAYMARRQKGAPRLASAGQLARQLLAVFPFELTAAQQRVNAEIASDLAQPYPMQRLLQGDVGSGKTIVAALAGVPGDRSRLPGGVHGADRNLAGQHYLKLRSWLEPLGIEVAWLTGSLKKAARLASQHQASTSAQLIVGTHASDPGTRGLRPARSGHRRRAAPLWRRAAARTAAQGGQSAPAHDVGDADPAHAGHELLRRSRCFGTRRAAARRRPIRTKLVSDARRDEVIARVRGAVAIRAPSLLGCPLIEESEKLQLQTALDTHAALSAELDDLRIGLVHGRLKADEKAATMAAFAAGEIDVLVATTVIEVGVDVQNASLMVIEHAERFGLSQLHSCADVSDAARTIRCAFCSIRNRFRKPPVPA